MLLTILNQEETRYEMHLRICEHLQCERTRKIVFRITWYIVSPR
jgi:hypothetical protein